MNRTEFIRRLVLQQDINPVEKNLLMLFFHSGDFPILPRRFQGFNWDQLLSSIWVEWNHAIPQCDGAMLKIGAQLFPHLADRQSQNLNVATSVVAPGSMI